MNQGNVDMKAADGAASSSESEQPFALLESLLWTREEGYFVLSYHRERLCRSARTLGVRLDMAAFERALERMTDGCDADMYKVRIVVQRDGIVTAERHPLTNDVSRAPVNVGLARRPVDATNPMLCHKTTCRTLYEAAAAERPDCDDVILYNEHGQITESCVANIVIENGGRRLTPALECGLLPGTFRAYLLDQGEIEESVISTDQLLDCDCLYLINSVRKWVVTAWVEGA